MFSRNLIILSIFLFVFTYCGESGTSYRYYWSNGYCYDSNSGDKVDTSYCSTSSTSTDYYLSNGLCYSSSTGLQVNISYCNESTSGYYWSNGYCYSTSTGQQVSSTYCSSGSYSNMQGYFYKAVYAYDGFESYLYINSQSYYVGENTSSAVSTILNSLNRGWYTISLYGRIVQETGHLPESSATYNCIEIQQTY